MTDTDPELEILSRYRHARPVPIVDVVDRVTKTIGELPQKSRRTDHWTMAACAAVCASAAALLLLAAVIRPGNVDEPASLFDLVVDSQDVDVQSLLH